MYSDMSMRIRCSSESNRNAGERLAQLGLAHARGAEEQERAVGPVRIRQPRARAPDGVRDEAHRLVLADHALVQPVFHLDAASRARPASSWTPGCRSRATPPRRFPPRRPGCAAASPSRAGLALLRFLHLRLELRQLAVLELGELLVLALALGSSSICSRSFSISSLMCWLPATCAFSAFQISSRSEYSFSSFCISSSISAKRFLEASSFSLRHRLALDAQLDQAPLEPVHRLGLGVDLHLDARRRLVDQVDRLVGQEAVGDVAVRELGRGDDRRVGDLDAVVQLVASPAGRAGWRSSPPPRARRPAPSGSGARARRPSPRTCGIRSGWWRRCSAARPARARA